MFTEDLSAFFGADDPGVVAAVVNGSTVYGQLDYELDETMESPTRRGVPSFICSKAARTKK